jgi:hypothetical protein
MDRKSCPVLSESTFKTNGRLGRLRSVALFPIEHDISGTDTRLSNSYWTLYVRAILDQGFDFNGGQGWN